MSEYLLAKHVFVCVHGDDAVFLDLQADRYLAVNAARVTKLMESGLAGPDLISATTEAGKLAQTLLHRGLLTTDPARGKQPELTRPEPPVIDLSEEISTLSSAPRVMDVLRFVRATIMSLIFLTFGSLKKAVDRVSERKAARAQDAPPLDLRVAAQCMARFENIRPFFFSSRDMCLFESCVLIEFFSLYGLYPDWVFGVHTSPFTAHCWVQHQHIVFNDTAEHVCAFTGILVA